MDELWLSWAATTKIIAKYIFFEPIVVSSSFFFFFFQVLKKTVNNLSKLNQNLCRIPDKECDIFFRNWCLFGEDIIFVIPIAWTRAYVD